MVILLTICFFFFIQWYNSYDPSQGIWQYKDDDLEINIYVPKEGDIGSSPSGYVMYKCDLSYKGEKQELLFLYHFKMYWVSFVSTDHYEDILKSDDLTIDDQIIRTSYKVPIKKGEWEFKSISVYVDYLKDYEGKNLLFTRIGDYK